MAMSQQSVLVLVATLAVLFTGNVRVFQIPSLSLIVVWPCIAFVWFCILFNLWSHSKLEEGISSFDSIYNSILTLINCSESNTRAWLSHPPILSTEELSGLWRQVKVVLGAFDGEKIIYILCVHLWILTVCCVQVLLLHCRVLNFLHHRHMYSLQ